MKKTKNRNSRKAARAHRNKVTMIGITSVVCLLMVILLVQGQRLNAQASANEQRLSLIHIFSSVSFKRRSASSICRFSDFSLRVIKR